MCGRVKLEGDITELRVKFGIPDGYPAPNYAPSWNVAPTDSVPIVRYNAKEGHRALDLMRWGLVPYLGEGHQSQLREHQRDGRDDRHQARLSGRVRPTPLPRAD